MSQPTQTFRELLSQPTDVVERPRPLETGHYYAEVRSHEFGRSKQKQTAQVSFAITPTEATADVDVEKNEGITLENVELRKILYITPKSMYRITDFLDAVLGKETGRSFDERIPETRGARVIIQVSQREVLDDEGNVVNTFNDVGNVVKA